MEHMEKTPLFDKITKYHTNSDYYRFAENTDSAYTFHLNKFVQKTYNYLDKIDELKTRFYENYKQYVEKQIIKAVCYDKNNFRLEWILPKLSLLGKFFHKFFDFDVKISYNRLIRMIGFIAQEYDIYINPRIYEEIVATEIEYFDSIHIHYDIPDDVVILSTKKEIPRIESDLVLVYKPTEIIHESKERMTLVTKSKLINFNEMKTSFPKRIKRLDFAYIPIYPTKYTIWNHLMEKLDSFIKYRLNLEMFSIR